MLRWAAKKQIAQFSERLAGDCFEEGPEVFPEFSWQHSGHAPGFDDPGSWTMPR
jgi:hypothetical protein